MGESQWLNLSELVDQDVNTEDARSSALVLAEALLRAELQRLVLAEPGRALELVGRFVQAMHAEALVAVDAARRSGVGFENIGRALSLLEDSGIILLQAAAVLLGLPAASRAAEAEMLVALRADEADSREPGDEIAALPPQRDVWAEAVERFREGTGGRRVVLPFH
ncbi:hypothetical protein [Kitasatospora kifunensis]|uniref:Uncharacterized protein n=1 Tax=Kitasatospora kifunensis TaxID=58351 RepID=A0A7W7RCI4_KITKI|nr:hypothetical protein [Kitasatospora kifunensis]MBB4929093.1 hypothetical protein [Kitasatospora kifunensis]